MDFGEKNTRKLKRELNKKGPKIKKKVFVIFTKAFLVLVLAVVVAGVSAGIGAVRGIIDNAPDISEIDATPRGYQSVLLDGNGDEIMKLVAQGGNRVYATLDEIPEDLQHAFVAIEDERFYEHNGIDIRAILRAGVHGVMNGFHFTEGGSTITQQLLKNNVFDNWVNESKTERVKRKLQEQYLAVELEKIQDKDWILENYLNTINMGQNTLGVQAASRRYFGKNVSELTLSECAVMAAITNNPERYNPIHHPEKNAARRETVLNYMKEQGYIDQVQFDEAMADNVYERIQEVNMKFRGQKKEITSYFVDAAMEQVIEDLQEELGYSETQAYTALYSGGLTVCTTLDPQLQDICDAQVSNADNYDEDTSISVSFALSIQREDGSIDNYDQETMLSYYQEEDEDYNLEFDDQAAAQEAYEAYKAQMLSEGGSIVEGGERVTYVLQPQVAVTVMDQYTGEVKAIVGGRGDKVANRTLNRATSSTRQPGSTFKVLATYAAALDKGGMTLASVQDDAPYEYENGETVKNYDNRYRGYTTLHQAITNSINVVTVKTLTDITPQLGYDYLLNMGFTTLDEKEDVLQPLALGGITYGVTNLELTAAYAMIANDGTYIKPRFYTQILDHEGNVLLDKKAESHTVLKETTAYLLTTAMEDVMTQGTGKTANLEGMTAAGKTGTTNDNRVTLFAGFTPYYTCVVWGAYDDNSSLEKTQFSRTLWKNIMQEIHTGLEDKEFEQPEDIVTAKICTKSGKLAVSGLCNRDPRGSMVVTEYFEKGTEPTEVCDHHVGVTICKESGMVAGEFCPDDKKQTKAYMTEGSSSTEDARYILTRKFKSTTCNIHTKKQEEPEEEDEKDSEKKNDSKKNEKQSTSENVSDILRDILNQVSR